MTVHFEHSIERAIGVLDFERIAREYHEQNECVYLERLLPPEALSAVIAEVDRLRPAVHWNYVPWVRRGGNVGYRRLLREAPAMMALYRSPAFIDFMSRLTGRELFLKSEDDDHACALYYYNRSGDHMRSHYDTCGCEEGASYTIIVGLVDRSTSRLACHLYKDDPKKPTRTLHLATRPGSMVIFNGSKLYHGVTPLGPGEERVVLSLSYVTESRMSRSVRFKENIKDALLYFGLPAMLQNNYTWGLRSRKESESPASLRVLVTGGSSGIGREIALRYARRGARVALFARRRERLEEAARACADAGASETLVLAGDTSAAADVEAAAAELHRAFGHVDRAYLNAGGYGDRSEGPLACWSTSFSARRVERVIRTNYLGVVYWMDALLPAMRARRSGTIAITGAMAADRGLPGSGPYAASKAALRALVDGLRADAGRHGIRLCLLEPGFVQTELTDADCCVRMPFIQRADDAAEAFVEGVERGARVVRFPWQWSVVSRLGAEVPRFIYDRWAEGLLPKGGAAPGTPQPL